MRIALRARGHSASGIWEETSARTQLERQRTNRLTAISVTLAVRAIHGSIFLCAGTDPGAGLTTANANMGFDSRLWDSGRDSPWHTCGHDLREICKNFISH